MRKEDEVTLNKLLGQFRGKPVRLNPKASFYGLFQVKENRTTISISQKPIVSIFIEIGKYHFLDQRINPSSSGRYLFESTRYKTLRLVQMILPCNIKTRQREFSMVSLPFGLD